MSYARLLTAFICLNYFFCYSTSFAETKLQIIMCADTNDKDIGDLLHIDVGHIQTAFTTNVPQRLYSFHELSGDQATATQITRTIRSVPIDSDDTIIFIFSGHGAFDTNSNEHVITLSNGENIARSAIRKELQRKGAKLNVLITDTCSNFRKFATNSPSANGVQKVTPLFDELFFRTRGVVDISATKPGELGQINSGGSAFIRGFTSVLYNSNRRISWAEVVAETNINTKNDDWFQNLNQTAYAVAPLPSRENNNAPVPRQKYWLGAYAQAYSGGGVEITKVVANSPASQIRDSRNNSFQLVPFRDIVTHVNGRAVNNNDQFIAAIRASGRIAKLRVYDRQTRQAGLYDAYLTPLR